MERQRTQLTASLSLPTIYTCVRSHYRRRLLCRVSQTLPSAFYRALGKEAVCRVSERKHSANNKHSPKRWSVGHSANQNTRQRAVAVNGRQPPFTLCRVSSPDTRQSGDLPSVIFWHSANHFFFHFWPPNFFCSPHTIPGTPCSNVAHFSDFFYISLIYFI